MKKQHVVLLVLGVLLSLPFLDDGRNGIRTGGYMGDKVEVASLTDSHRHLSIRSVNDGSVQAIADFNSISVVAVGANSSFSGTLTLN